MRGVPASLEFYDGLTASPSELRGWAVVEDGSLHYSCMESSAALDDDGVDLTHADLELVDPLAGYSS